MARKAAAGSKPLDVVDQQLIAAKTYASECFDAWSLLQDFLNSSLLNRLDEPIGEQILRFRQGVAAQLLQGLSGAYPSALPLIELALKGQGVHVSSGSFEFPSAHHAARPVLELLYCRLDDLHRRLCSAGDTQEYRSIVVHFHSITTANIPWGIRCQALLVRELGAARNWANANRQSPVVAALAEGRVEAPTQWLGAPNVVIHHRHSQPTVRGAKVDLLTDAQYDVIDTLLRNGGGPLSKTELEDQSKHTDARKILRRLADSDDRWKSVIEFAKKKGQGYRLILHDPVPTI